MGTVAHHQEQAAYFLQHAQNNILDRDPDRAARAIARAVSHTTTALAVHSRARHKSRRQLRFVLQCYVNDGKLSRSHFKTFREACDPPSGPPSQPAKSKPARSHPAQSVDDKDRLIALRRLRRRASAFANAANALIVGEPLPIHRHQRYVRKPDEPVAPNFASVHDIITLPDYLEIRNRFRLNDDFAAKTDPHNWYRMGYEPRPCPCHPKPRNASKNSAYIILSPLWQRALEQTFHIKLPAPLYLRA